MKKLVATITALLLAIITTAPAAAAEGDGMSGRPPVAPGRQFAAPEIRRITVAGTVEENQIEGRHLELRTDDGRLFVVVPGNGAAARSLQEAVGRKVVVDGIVQMEPNIWMRGPVLVAESVRPFTPDAVPAEQDKQEGNEQGAKPAPGGNEAPATVKEPPDGDIGKAEVGPLPPERNRPALERVLRMLEAKREWLNPKAAENVGEVVERLKALAKEGNQNMPDTDAAEVVRMAVEERFMRGKLDAGDLDILAEVEAERGDTNRAMAALEQRLRMDWRSKAAHRRLAEILARTGAPELETLVNGRRVAFDVRPVVRDGRTLVPVRAVTEALGAKVAWEETTRTVTITRDNTTVEIQIDRKDVKVNGKTVTLDVPAAVVGGRTMVPLRFVAEALGLHVDWFDEAKMIAITEEPLE